MPGADLPPSQSLSSRKTTISRWKTPILSSVPGFHNGAHWRFCLQFPSCLESAPRFHIEHCWWQLQFSIYFEISPESSFIWVFWFNPFPNLRFHGNWWWLLARVRPVQPKNGTGSNFRTRLGSRLDWV